MGKLEALESAIKSELIGKTMKRDITIVSCESKPHRISHTPKDKDDYSMDEWTRVSVSLSQVRGKKKVGDDDLFGNCEITNASFDIISYDKDLEKFTIKLIEVIGDWKQ